MNTIIHKYGTFSYLTFSASETPEGKKRIDKLFSLLQGKTDYEIAKFLFNSEDEKELLSLSGLDIFCHDTIKLTPVDQFTFNLKWHTFYYTPIGIFQELVNRDPDLLIDGYVEITFYDGENDISVQGGLVMGGPTKYWHNEITPEEQQSLDKIKATI